MQKINTITINGRVCKFSDPDAVSYEEQNPTDEQKENARNNLDVPQDEAPVGSAVWSSKNIVDKLCPSLEQSGTLVQCEPIDGYPLEVTASGGGEFVVTACGKNLYDREKYPLSPGMYVSSSGATTGYTNDSKYAACEHFVPVSHLCGKPITLNHPPAEIGGSGPRMVFYTEAAIDSVIPNINTNGHTIIVPEEAHYMRFSVPKNYVDGSQIQIEIGSVVTDYEPYFANTATGSDGKAVVLAAKGLNNVFAYSGDKPAEITVAGKADPVAVIEKLTNAVLSLGGNI